MTNFLIGFFFGIVASVSIYVLYTRPALRAKIEEELKTAYTSLSKKV